MGSNGYTLLPTADDKKTAQQVFEQKQVQDKNMKRKWKLFGVFILSFLALSSWVVLCSSGTQNHKLFKHHGHGLHKKFSELEDVFKGFKAEEFAGIMENNLNTEKVLGHNHSCDIFVETITGLKEHKEDAKDYFSSKIDFDLCRYKDQVGIDVPQLWKYFTKVLEVSNIKLKLDYKYGSCNLSPGEVYGYYKNFYPIKGAIWTGYVKPEGTHDKLTGAIIKSEKVGKYYNFTNTAAINLLLKVPFQKKVVVISQQVSDVIRLDENNKPLNGGTLKVKKTLFIKSAYPGQPHGHKQNQKFSQDPFFIPPDSMIKKTKNPCPRKLDPNHAKDQQNKDLTKVKLEKPARQLKNLKLDKHEAMQKLNATLEQKHQVLEDMHKKIENMSKDDQQNGSKLQFLDSVINYIDRQIQKLTTQVKGEANKNSGDNNILVAASRNKVHDERSEPKFRFKPVLFDDKKDGKWYHKEDTQENNHKQTENGVDHHRPRILALTEYKGFVYGQDIGFGISAGGGAIVETPSGYLSESTGLLKFGYCYDP